MFGMFNRCESRNIIVPQSIKYIISIPKENGSFRKFVIPSNEFNVVMKRINNKLNIITHYHIQKNNLTDVIHGFIHHKNAQTNALKHKDFFGTVTFDMKGLSKLYFII